MTGRIWRVVTRTLLTLAILVAAVLIAGLSYRAYRQHEISRTTRIDPVRGVDDELFTTIGGVEQWVSIRGQDRNNPIILLVHGGPGLATSPFPRTFLFSWTRDFTVVRWDQRGAGKTFGRSGPPGASVTMERMARDGIEVAGFVRTTLGKSKVVLVGHSWGSSIGVRMVRMRPDVFYAYVGTGQSVNQGKFKAMAYAQLLEQARARRDRRALEELTAIGPPPYDSVAKARVHTKWANEYEPGQFSTWGLLTLVLFDSGIGPRDLRDYVRGIVESENHFRPEVDRDDVPSLGTEFTIPMFVFQGEQDNVTPVAPVRDYFEHIAAPHKELVLIPNAGHNALATRSDDFLRLLVERVKPLTNTP